MIYTVEQLLQQPYDFSLKAVNERLATLAPGTPVWALTLRPSGWDWHSFNEHVRHLAGRSSYNIVAGVVPPRGITQLRSDQDIRQLEGRWYPLSRTPQATSNHSFEVWAMSILPLNAIAAFDPKKPAVLRGSGAAVEVESTGDPERPFAAWVDCGGTRHRLTYLPNGMFYGRLTQPVDIMNP